MWHVQLVIRSIFKVQLASIQFRKWIENFAMPGVSSEAFRASKITQRKSLIHCPRPNADRKCTDAISFPTGFWLRDTFTDLRWNFASPWQLIEVTQFDQSKSSLSLRNIKRSNACDWPEWKKTFFFRLRSPSSEGVGQKTWYLGLSTSKVLLIFVVFIGQIQKIRTEN